MSNKHKALLVQEGLTLDQLPEKIKRKMLRYNSIENSNSFYYRTKDKKLTKKAIDELDELDEDICELIDVFLVQKQSEIERLEQERLAAEQAEAERLENERLESERLQQEEANRIATEEAEKQKLIQQQQKPKGFLGLW